MTALTADRDTPQRTGLQISVPMKAGVRIYTGSIIALDTTTGYSAPASTATTLRAVGVAQDQFDNTGGADGAVSALANRGTYRFANSAGTDLIATKNIGANCYLVDDQTVALTDGTTTRSIAGVIADVDDLGVWVKF